MASCNLPFQLLFFSCSFVTHCSYYLYFNVLAHILMHLTYLMRGVGQPHCKGKKLTLCFGVQVTKPTEATTIFVPLPYIS